jgi:hypothetical protein
MNESDKHREPSARDIELSRRIAETLDRSAAQIDAPTRARLAAIRHAALSRSRSRTRRAVAGLALAASLIAIVATPWMLQHRARVPAQGDAAYLNVDPEMLADMDMLQAIGESQ